jgi:hypothetical protein
MTARVTDRDAATQAFAAVHRTSVVLALLVALASVVGVASGGGGFYDAYPASLAGMVGQDVASLIVGVPILLVAGWYAGQASIRAVLILGGTLFYVAYSYFFFVVGGFNALFLVYIAIVALALYALLALLVTIDPAAIAARFDDQLPRRLVSGFLIGIALLFVVMWGGMSLSSIAASKTPDVVTVQVVALDGMVLLPALLLGGWLLWRRAAWGLLLGGVLLVKAVLTGGTLAFTTLLGWAWKGSIEGLDAFLLVLFGLMALVALALADPYFRHIHADRVGRSGAISAMPAGSRP